MFQNMLKIFESRNTTQNDKNRRRHKKEKKKKVSGWEVCVWVWVCAWGVGKGSGESHAKKKEGFTYTHFFYLFFLTVFPFLLLSPIDREDNFFWRLLDGFPDCYCLACKDRNSEITRLSISAQSARGFDVLLAVLDHKIKSISEGRQFFFFL